MTHTTGAEMMSYETGAEAVSDATGAEAVSDATCAEMMSDATGAEMMSDATCAEAVSDATGTEMMSDATCAEAVSDATCAEAVSDATGAEAVSDATGAEATTDGAANFMPVSQTPLSGTDALYNSTCSSVNASARAVDYAPNVHIFQNTKGVNQNNARELRIDRAAISSRLMVDSLYARIIAETIGRLWDSFCKDPVHNTRPNILEPTACCGGTVLAFLTCFLDSNPTKRVFENVYAIEQKKQRCEYLEHNYSVVKRSFKDKIQDKFEVRRGDYRLQETVKYFENTPIDVIFFDPVWYDLFPEALLQSSTSDDSFTEEITPLMEYFKESKSPRIFAMKCPPETKLVENIRTYFETQHPTTKFQILEQNFGDTMLMVYVLLDPRTVPKNASTTRKLSMDTDMKYRVLDATRKHSIAHAPIRAANDQIKTDELVRQNKRYIIDLVTWLKEQPGNILDSDTFVDLTYLNSAVHAKLLRAYRNALGEFFQRQPSSKKQRSKKQRPDTRGQTQESRVKNGSLVGWYLLRSIIRLESADEQKRALEQMRGWDGVKAAEDSTGWTKKILAPFLIEVEQNSNVLNETHSIKFEISTKKPGKIPTKKPDVITITYNYSTDRRAFILYEGESLPTQNFLTKTRDLKLFVPNYRTIKNKIQKDYNKEYVYDQVTKNEIILDYLNTAYNNKLEKEVDFDLKTFVQMAVTANPTRKADIEAQSTTLQNFFEPGTWTIVYNRQNSEVEIFKTLGHNKWEKIKTKNDLHPDKQISNITMRQGDFKPGEIFRGCFYKLLYSIQERYVLEEKDLGDKTIVSGRNCIHTPSGFWKPPTAPAVGGVYTHKYNGLVFASTQSTPPRDEPGQDQDVILDRFIERQDSPDEMLRYFYVSKDSTERATSLHNGQCKLMHTHIEFYFKNVLHPMIREFEKGRGEEYKITPFEFEELCRDVTLMYVGAANTKNASGERWKRYPFDTEQLNPELEIEDRDFKMALEMANAPENKAPLSIELKWEHVPQDCRTEIEIGTEKGAQFSVGNWLRPYDMPIYFKYSDNGCFEQTKPLTRMQRRNDFGTTFPEEHRIKGPKFLKWFAETYPVKATPKESLRLPLAQLGKAVGLTWKKVDTDLPDVCKKIENADLCNRLNEGQFVFSQEEWDSFGIGNLSMSNYVEVDNQRYQPAQRVEDKIDIQEGSWIMLFGSSPGDDEDGGAMAPQCYVASGTSGSRYLADFLSFVKGGDIVLVDPQAIDEVQLRDDLRMAPKDPRLRVWQQNFDMKSAQVLAEEMRAPGLRWKLVAKETLPNDATPIKTPDGLMKTMAGYKCSFADAKLRGMPVDKDDKRKDFEDGNWVLINDMHLYFQYTAKTMTWSYVHVGQDQDLGKELRLSGVEFETWFRQEIAPRICSTRMPKAVWKKTHRRVVFNAVVGEQSSVDNNKNLDLNFKRTLKAKSEFLMQDLDAWGVEVNHGDIIQVPGTDILLTAEITGGVVADEAVKSLEMDLTTSCYVPHDKATCWVPRKTVPVFISDARKDTVLNDLSLDQATTKLLSEISTLSESNQVDKEKLKKRAQNARLCKMAMDSEETIMSYVQNAIWLLLFAGLFHGKKEAQCYGHIKTSLVSFANIARKLPLLFEDYKTGKDYTSNLIEKMLVSEFFQNTSEGYGRRDGAMECRSVLRRGEPMVRAGKCGFLRPKDLIATSTLFFNADNSPVPEGGQITLQKYSSGQPPKGMFDATDLLGTIHTTNDGGAPYVVAPAMDTVGIPKSDFADGHSMFYLWRKDTETNSITYYIPTMSFVTFEGINTKQVCELCRDSTDNNEYRMGGTDNAMDGKVELKPISRQIVINRDFANIKSEWNAKIMPWVPDLNQYKASKVLKTLAAEVHATIGKAFAGVVVSQYAHRHKQKPTLRVDPQAQIANKWFDEEMKIAFLRAEKLEDQVASNANDIPQLHAPNLNLDKALEETLSNYEKQQHSCITWRDKLTGPFWMVGYIPTRNMATLCGALHYQSLTKDTELGESLMTGTVSSLYQNVTNKAGLAALHQTLNFTMVQTPFVVDLCTQILKQGFADEVSELRKHQLIANLAPGDYRRRIQNSGYNENMGNFVVEVEKALAIRWYNVITLFSSFDAPEYLQRRAGRGALLRRATKLHESDGQQWKLTDYMPKVDGIGYNLLDSDTLTQKLQEKLAQDTQDNPPDTLTLTSEEWKEMQIDFVSTFDVVALHSAGTGVVYYRPDSEKGLSVSYVEDYDRFGLAWQRYDGKPTGLEKFKKSIKIREYVQNLTPYERTRIIRFEPDERHYYGLDNIGENVYFHIDINKTGDDREYYVPVPQVRRQQSEALSSKPPYLSVYDLVRTNLFALPFHNITTWPSRSLNNQTSQAWTAIDRIIELDLSQILRVVLSSQNFGVIIPDVLKPGASRKGVNEARKYSDYSRIKANDHEKRDAFQDVYTKIVRNGALNCQNEFKKLILENKAIFKRGMDEFKSVHNAQKLSSYMASLCSDQTRMPFVYTPRKNGTGRDKQANNLPIKKQNNEEIRKILSPNFYDRQSQYIQKHFRNKDMTEDDVKKHIIESIQFEMEIEDKKAEEYATGLMGLFWVKRK